MTVFPERFMDHILPPNATKFEHSVASEVDHILSIDIPIRDLWNPETCPEAFLPFLAWSVSVDIWNADWPIEKKRYIVSQAILDHRLKGTETGLRRSIGYAGGNVERIITPPQLCYTIDDWNEEEQAQYLDQLDEVRVYRYFPVDLKADGIFASESDFFDDGFFNSESGYYGYRKTAILFKPNGEQIDLSIDWQLQVSDTGVSTEIERIVLPAKPDTGFYAESDFLGEDFFDRDGVSSRLIEIHTGGTSSTTYGLQQFGVVFPKNERISIEPKLIVERRPADFAGTLADDDFYDDGFLMPDRGWEQIYERYFIANPDAQIGVADAMGSYFDDALFDMAPYTAEVTVDLTGVQIEVGAEEYLDEGYFLPPELEKLEDTIDAIRATKSLSDLIYLNTATRRFPRLGDAFKFDGSWPLGEMIKDR